MLQVYHPNAVTNIHIRRQIKESPLTNFQLAQIFNTSPTTISKWKNRETYQDKSSRPHKITYALNELEENLVVSIRKTTWLSLDEVWEMLYVYNPQITRSSVYRTFCRNSVNKLPEHEKQNAKKFKEYEPGYLHIDVTYLPKFEGNSSYLFVAIDRATRCLFYQLYDAKNSENAEDFLYKCLDFFPFKITHVLTDNGLEFTNRLIKSKKGMLCQKPSKLDEACIANHIEHRLTQPNSPKTNGMVERANGIIKKATILKEHYANKKEMNEDLMAFLVYYILYRRHGSLKNELHVKTPFQAIEIWFSLKPDLFKQNPCLFKYKILSLHPNKNLNFYQQPCET